VKYFLYNKYIEKSEYIYKIYNINLEWKKLIFYDKKCHIYLLNTYKYVCGL